MTRQDTGPAPTSFKKEYYDAFVQNRTQANRDRCHQRVAEVLSLCGARRGRLLSVGAAGLVEATAFLQAGFEVTTIDVASSLTDQARQAGLHTHIVDLDCREDEIPGRYDVICCLEVLEHVTDPQGALKKLRAALQDGGKMFVSLPDEFHVVTRLKVLLGRPHFVHYNWPHIRFFNQRAALDLFSAAGLRVVAVRHIPLVPPRMKGLQGLGRPFCAAMPGLFSIAHLYQLEPVGQAR